MSTITDLKDAMLDAHAAYIRAKDAYETALKAAHPFQTGDIIRSTDERWHIRRPRCSDVAPGVAQRRAARARAMTATVSGWSDRTGTTHYVQFHGRTHAEAWEHANDFVLRNPGAVQGPVVSRGSGCMCVVEYRAEEG